ncbi:hypothetical protein WR25_16876 [Diploscapter pachys]|uniref:Uncharacterized protein n=1 Tax=Diploscapter pachys TaxID=2018661 RepID=A0A2A2LDF8_9BILA|nr:hypothetical protein WR25_16876 [Diploscapter pachys]
MNGVILLSLIPAAVLATFSCKNQAGNNVDWFAVYKMPIVPGDTSINGVQDGVGFYYLDAKSPGAFVPSTKMLNDTKQAIAYTLQQFYTKQNDSTVFHPYDGDSDTDDGGDASESTKYGHTKDSGQDYGQTMLCMTFKYAELSKIGTQLFYNRPSIYSSFLPTTMSAANPDLVNALAAQYSKNASSIFSLTTKGGVTFTSFAKSKYFNADLYDSLVAPTLKTDLTVESWRRGGLISLQCSLTYHANDALSIHVGNTPEFSYTKDHSKMARSTDSSKPYVCIGDINRMTSQYVRGGGTLCTNSSSLWGAFNVIATQNSC